MDYRFEELQDRHFQLLCQSLLVKEYSEVQCFPLGMADGGRDATTLDMHGVNAVVFQVKFSESPRAQKNPIAWMKHVIDSELPSIAELAKKGATRYILITNMEGTAQPDVGRIDQVQEYFNQHIPIPGMVWWRGEVSRRLDANFDVLLKYPALLSGTDMLRLIAERTVTEGRSRRENSLRAYLGDQHNKDKVIRFKQADDLSGDLLQLFVDVPLQLNNGSALERRLTWLAYRHVDGNDAHSGYFRNTLPSPDTDWDDANVVAVSSFMTDQLTRRAPGAASLVLDSDFGASFQRIVIEGAPGQGKSTLAQYLAEVQRIRILGKESLLTRLPDTHATSPVMLPLKLELRDLAAWLSGSDPWNTHKKHHDLPRTLEVAIAAHIAKFSGGLGFDADDLVQVLSETPTILILDALDEVADIQARTKVVDEVIAGLARMSENTADLRVIITSRPTAVEGAPAFPAEEFSHVTLAAIPTQLAVQYAQQWGEARQLSAEDIVETQTLLDASLDVPHIAELAKNTMQLSILLTLIRVVGASLPDQRTELYDEYVKIFLNRESEKSQSVRKYRELLVDIHRYLGFYLHAEAEANGTDGRISRIDLKNLISEYLEREDRKPELADELISGMVERVVALVSRVEGTFEFEVQPLREYFAARHLYDSARYMPAAQDTSGGKPDRFDGIAPNPYWQNVARFFAGCFTKGELAGLAEQVANLIESEDGTASYPRSLAVMLVQDWVFSTQLRSLRTVMESTFNNRGRIWGSVALVAERHQIAGPLAPGGLYMPEPAAERLLEMAWPDIHSAAGVLTERTRGACRLLQAQGYSLRMMLRQKWFGGLSGRTGPARDAWFDVGAELGVFQDLDRADLDRVLDGITPLQLSLVVAGTDDIYQMSEAEVRSAAAAAMDWPTVFGGGYRNLISRLVVMLGPGFLDSLLRRGRDGTSVRRSASSLLFSRRSAAGVDVEPQPADRALEPLTMALTEAYRIADRRDQHELESWRVIHAALHKAFGHTVMSIEVAVGAGVIRARGDRSVKADELFDDSRPLPDRVQAARTRADDPGWWRAQADGAYNDHERYLWLLCAAAWADSATLTGIIDAFNVNLAKLPPHLRDQLVRAVAMIGSVGRPATRVMQLSAAQLQECGTASCGYAVLLPRLKRPIKPRILSRTIEPTHIGPLAATFCLAELFQLHREGRIQDAAALDAAAGFHAAGATSISLVDRDKSQPAPWDDHVLQRQQELPDCYVALAYARSARVGRPCEPVLSIAERQKWFD